MHWVSQKGSGGGKTKCLGFFFIGHPQQKVEKKSRIVSYGLPEDLLSKGQNPGGGGVQHPPPP